MPITEDQLRRLENAYRLAKQAHQEYMSARAPLVISNQEEIGSALSLAETLLESLVRHVQAAGKRQG